MNKYLKIAIIVVCLIVGGWLAIKYVVPLVLPFLVAAMLTLLLDPLVTGMTKKLKIPRTISVILVIVAVCLLAGIVVSVAVTEVVVEVDELSKTLTNVDRSFSDVIQDIVNWATDIFDSLPNAVSDFIAVNQNKVTDILQKVVEIITSVIRVLPQIAVVFVIGIISTFFMLRDKETISKFLNTAYNGKHKKAYLTIKRELSEGFVGYIKAQLVLMSITMALTIITLSFFKVKYAWLLGIACGILDLIPLIGPSLIYIPWIVYLLISGNTTFALQLLITFFVTSMIREFLSAKIVGKNLGLHPLIAIMSVYIGLQAFGTIGFLLGPLIVIFVRSIYKAFVKNKEIVEVKE